MLWYVILLGLWVWGLVSACQYSEDEYRAVGRSKTAWIIGIVLLGALGAGIWALVARPSLAITTN